MNRHLLSLVVLALASTTLTCADEIILKRSVRIRHDGEAVLLADIARLDGEHAKKLADLKIDRFVDRTRPLEITVSEVEAVLDRAGINRARIDLSGNRVIVRPFTRANSASQGPALCAPLKLGTQNEDSAALDRTDDSATSGRKEPMVKVDPRAVVGEDTARGLIAMRLAPQWRELEVPVRLNLRTPLVETLNRQNARPVVQEVGRAGTSAHAFSVTFEGERPVRVIASIEVNVLASQVRTDLKRNDFVGHSDINVTPKWVALHDMKAVTSSSSLLGKQLDSHVKTGELLKPHHFKPVIRRNDAIKVTSSGNGFSLELDCVSLEDGRVGQTIAVRTDTPGGRFASKNKPIRVVVTDTGRAEALN